MSLALNLGALALCGLLGGLPVLGSRVCSPTLFAPTGIGIGATPGDGGNLPTDGKVGQRPAPVTALGLSADGKTLLVGDANGRLRRFPLTLQPEGGGELGPELLVPWKDGRQAGSIEVILKRPKRTWVGLDDGTFAELNSTAIVPSKTRQPEGVLALVAGPAGRLAAASANGEIRIYDAEGTLQSTILAHELATVALASEPGKTPRLWSLGWDGRLCGWRWPKVKKGKKSKVGSAKAGHRRKSGRSRRASSPKLSKPRFEFKLGQREPTSLALIPVPDSAKGKDAQPRLLVADFQGTLRRVDLLKRKLKAKPFATRPNMELVTRVVVSPSGARGIALASAEQTVLLFDPNDTEQAPRVLRRFEIPPARALFLSETTLAIGFYDGSVQLVKVAK